MRIKCLYDQKGLTLIELMVTITLFGLIATAIMNVYVDSNRTYMEQLESTEAQQNLRSGIDALVQDLRMAGFEGRGGGTAGFLTAGSSSVQFTMDTNEDGDVADTNETLTYSLYTPAGMTYQNLGRASGVGPNSPVAEYIDDLAFAYAYDANADGVLDVNGSGRTIWAVIGANGNWFNLDANDDGIISAADDTNGDGTLNSTDTGTPADLETIRVVRIWMLARTSRPDNKYTSNTSYTVGDTVVTPNDNFHRRLLSTRVYIRNAGV